MLTSTFKAAVRDIERALEDLAIDVTFESTAQSTTYVPGQSQSPDTSSYSIKGVITSYKSHEIDGDRIRGDDIQLLVFAMDAPLPKSNDYTSYDGRKYRVVNSKPVFAGNVHLISTVQLRPYAD
jgi:hypothetical protein